MLKKIAFASAVLGALAPSLATAQRSTPVTVVNADALPVAVSEEPYQWPFKVGFKENEFGVCRPVPMPAGKTLMIEMVSAQLTVINASFDGSFFLDLRSVEAGGSTTRRFGGEIHERGFVPTTRQALFSMKLYAGPTTNGTDEVDVCVGPGTEAEGVVTGHLVSSLTITDPE
ncbi:MAG: hypothetical protein AAF317_16560 [Pseudomonadota bacterium]